MLILHFLMPKPVKKMSVDIRKCNINMIKPRFTNVKKVAILKSQRKK